MEILSNRIKIVLFIDILFEVYYKIKYFQKGLISLQDFRGGGATKQVTELAYGEVVAMLKAAGRPLTLTFKP